MTIKNAVIRILTNEDYMDSKEVIKRLALQGLEVVDIDIQEDETEAYRWAGIVTIAEMDVYTIIDEDGDVEAELNDTLSFAEAELLLYDEVE